MDENFEGCLKLKKAPVWRAAFAVVTVTIWLLCMSVVMPNTDSRVEAILVGVALLAAIAFVMFYLISNRISGLHYAGSHQIMTGKQNRYTYSLQEEFIHKEFRSSIKSWPVSNVIKAYCEQYFGVIVFKTSVIYLPFHGASKEEVVKFINQVSESVARQK